MQDHSLPVLAMPSVRKFARENGVELAKIKGTGRHGQVTKADIEQALSLPQDAPVAAPETKQKNQLFLPASASATWPETVEKDVTDQKSNC